MTSKKNILAVVSTEEEAQQALKLTEGKSGLVILALTLGAQYYLEKKIKGYTNPIYDLTFACDWAREYTFPNFAVSYKFCRGTVYRYIRDRFGYFLAELDKSLDFAKRTIVKFKPRIIYIGELENYLGSSVLYSNLKPHAFYLLAGQKRIPFKFLKPSSGNLSLRAMAGALIRLIRKIEKQKLAGHCDILVVATPRHLIQMREVISGLKKHGLKTVYLTYDLTVDYQRQLSKLLLSYLEKERLVDGQTKKLARQEKSSLLSEKRWQKFYAPKYKNQKKIIRFMREKLKNIVLFEMDPILTDTYLAKKVISHLAPKLLITTTDPDTKVLPYIDVAREAGIKTACIQHGAFFAKDSPTVYPQSEYFITWSTITKKWLTRVDHFKKVKMLVGNSPFHQNLQVRAKSSLSDKKVTILYLASVHLVDQSLVNYYLLKLFKILAEQKIKVEFLVRSHPNQVQFIENVKALLSNFPLESRLVNSQPLSALIKDSDLVIYEDTTAGFDAMLFKKPTIYFNPYTGQDFFDVRRYNAAMTILSEREIYQKIPSFLSNKKPWGEYSRRGHNYARRYLGADHNSRLANVMANLVKKS